MRGRIVWLKKSIDAIKCDYISFRENVKGNDIGAFLKFRERKCDYILLSIYSWIMFTWLKRGELKGNFPFC